MREVKAKFHFVAEAEGKSTIVKVKTIQLVGQPEIFLFPQNNQTAAQHEQLFQVAVVKGVVKSLKIRNKFRNAIITITDELRGIYLDEEGNVVFHDYYLEEVQTAAPFDFPASTSPQAKPIHSIAKNIVLEKFNGEKSNAKIWLKLFISECNRLEIQENKFSEVLRLFLEGSALEWYLNFLKIYSLTYPWEFWYNSFTDVFSQASWSQIEYAYAFKYLNGSFLNFALKKRSLLIDVDPELTLNSQINLIMIALPPFVRSKFLKQDFTTMDDLLSRLSQIEPKINKQNKTDNMQESQSPKKPCRHCEKLGFKNRFHPENLCWNKNKEIKLIKNDNIKIVNNIEAQEVVATCEQAKNE